MYLGCVTARVTPDKPRPKVFQDKNLVNLRMIIQGNIKKVLQQDGFSMDPLYAHVDDKAHTTDPRLLLRMRSRS